MSFAARAEGATLHCTIRGTAGADTLTGTASRDVICGKGGSDTLNGMGGDDLLIGGFGNDTLDGGSGNDVMKGSQGADHFVDLHGKDHIYGGDGNDPCMNGSDGAGGDALNGGPGKDGYNVDPGDNVAREPNDYWVDGQVLRRLGRARPRLGHARAVSRDQRSAHTCSSPRTPASCSPRGVSAYSIRTGVDGSTVRVTISAASSSLSRSDKHGVGDVGDRDLEVRVPARPGPHRVDHLGHPAARHELGRTLEVLADRALAVWRHAHTVDNAPRLVKIP